MLSIKGMTISVAVVAVIALPVVLLAVSEGESGDPKSASLAPEITGQMQNFELGKSTRPRPTFTWMNAKDETVSLADFEGKVVLLNFWATWCSPCIRELPSLNRLQAQLGGDKFVLVALNIDRAGKPVASKMARRLKLDALDLYMDPSLKSSRVLGVKVMPSTFLFDRLGREVGRMEGVAEWDAPEAVSLMKYFIDRPDYADKLPSVGTVVVE